MEHKLTTSDIFTYVPPWVKTNTRRFPRAKLQKAGGVLKTGDVLSIFHGEGLRADAKAFSHLLSHVKEVDGAHLTVVMVQVENETLLGDSRDGSAAAEKKRFQQASYRRFAVSHGSRFGQSPQSPKIKLEPLQIQASPSGSCAQALGKGPHADELFMAYHYAQYPNQVAAAGKKEHPVPLHTNVW